MRVRQRVLERRVDRSPFVVGLPLFFLLFLWGLLVVDPIRYLPDSPPEVPQERTELSGHVGAGVACSFYGVSESMRCLIAGLLERDPAFSEGEPWPQGDHSLFVAAGRPALALTSTDFEWLCREITHTERDRTELVDCDVLATTAVALRDLVMAIA